MSNEVATLGASARRRGPWSWTGEGAAAACRGLALAGVALVGAVMLAALAAGLVILVRLPGYSGPSNHGGLLRLGFVVVVIPGSLLCIRCLAGLTRLLAGKWCGVPIAAPYRPMPGGEGASPWSLLRRCLRWLLADPATWRDLLWMAAGACVGLVLAAAPAVLVLAGLRTMTTLRPFAQPFSAASGAWPAFPNAAALAIPLGLAAVAAGLWAAPRLLAVYGLFARTLLGPTRRAELAQRVDHLALTRSESIDTGAAEMRRIERDLHDGAQARLVAMGMALDAADHLLDTSPAAARALLAEARESSIRALAELRALVRGIHPPVLADRGLAEAVRALALDMPLRAHFDSELPGRAPAPAESAAYFAASELMANVSKHAGASQAWVEIRYDSGMLRISVTDDGNGGADPARGTGLRGIERRLAAFDGVLAVSSPLGGPTVVNMEIPCALSSPKTSSC
jgi:signal transduction histidine kinase